MKFQVNFFAKLKLKRFDRLVNLALIYDNSTSDTTVAQDEPKSKGKQSEFSKCNVIREGRANSHMRDGCRLSTTG